MKKEKEIKHKVSLTMCLISYDILVFFTIFGRYVFIQKPKALRLYLPEYHPML